MNTATVKFYSWSTEQGWSASCEVLNEETRRVGYYATETLAKTALLKLVRDEIIESLVYGTDVGVAQ